MVTGSPHEWADLIDSQVPTILTLTLESWEAMPVLDADAKENDITKALCRLLRQNRTARELPFSIQVQQVEIDPAPGEEEGRLDIAFNAMVPREDLYFCLEGKRLNVRTGGNRRPYASEYVTKGMMRFVTGQYSRAVKHGGMIGYVRDGNVPAAIGNVEANIRTHHVALGMTPPAAFSPSTALAGETRARETRHQRVQQAGPFTIHHLFVSSRL